MSVQPPIREGFQDVNWKHWLTLSMCLRRVISDDSSNNNRCFSFCEHVPRLAEEGFGFGCAVWKIEVCDNTEETSQDALCADVSTFFVYVSVASLTNQEEPLLSLEPVLSSQR